MRTSKFGTTFIAAAATVILAASTLLLANLAVAGRRCAPPFVLP
jgi:hypothetical protein